MKNNLNLTFNDTYNCYCVTRLLGINAKQFT